MNIGLSVHLPVQDLLRLELVRKITFPNAFIQQEAVLNVNPQPHLFHATIVQIE